MAHAQLLVMGGFALVHPASANPRYTVLTDEHFEKLLKDERVNFPLTTVPEIVDKSHVASKGFLLHNWSLLLLHWRA